MKEVKKNTVGEKEKHGQQGQVGSWVAGKQVSKQATKDGKGNRAEGCRGELGNVGVCAVALLSCTPPPAKTTVAPTVIRVSRVHILWIL